MFTDKTVVHFYARNLNAQVKEALCGKKIFPMIDQEDEADFTIRITKHSSLIEYCDKNLYSPIFEPCMRCQNHPQKDLLFLAQTDLE